MTDCLVDWFVDDFTAGQKRVDGYKIRCLPVIFVLVLFSLLAHSFCFPAMRSDLDTRQRDNFPCL